MTLPEKSSTLWNVPMTLEELGEIIAWWQIVDGDRGLMNDPPNPLYERLLLREEQIKARVERGGG